MATTPSEVRIGQVLLEEGLITQEQLNSALARQASAPNYVPLGRILVERKAITERQLSLVLERRGGGRLRLGELLVRNGALTEELLQQALVQQERLRRPLGEVLVRMGVVSDEAMRQALGVQLNIPFVDLDRIDADPRLPRLINSNYARRHMLVPIAQVGQMLTVCMDDPTNTGVIDELGASTGYVVNVVTAAQEAIRRAFERLYGQSIDAAPPVASQSVDFVEEIGIAGADAVGIADGMVKSEFIGEYVQGRNADTAVRQLLTLALDHHCSDIHLETLAAGTHVRFRMDGILQELDLGEMRETYDSGALQVISRIKILAKLDIAERRRPQDGAFRARFERGGVTEYVDFRVSILPGYYGESCVLRVLDKKNAPTSIEKLGFSPAITTTLKQLLKRPAGILLVAGPTGSGKSTTLYASLMATYRPEIRVLTAEDPIEYVYEQFSQSEVNERIGNTFARYLRAFLRHDPEVIMIGEIRDEETAEMAFRAAQTGHLLLSTLHANDAISSVTRLLDLKVDPNQLAASLLGVLSQRLIRCVCPECRQAYSPAPELVREFFPKKPDGLTFYHGIGCQACNFTGYRGRTCIAELWAPDEEDVILITKKAPFDEVRASARRTTVSMAQDVMDRLAAGRTTLEELVRMMPYAGVYQFRQLAAAGLLTVADAERQRAAAEGSHSGVEGSHAGEENEPADAVRPEVESRLVAFESPIENASGDLGRASETVDIEEPAIDLTLAVGTEQGPEPAPEVATEQATDPTPAVGGEEKLAGKDRLLATLSRLGRAQSAPDVMNVLADHAAAEDCRVAILMVDGSRLRAWALRGVPGGDPAAIDVPIVPNTLFDLAVRRGQPVSTSEAPVGFDRDPLSDLLAVPADRAGLAVPISAGGSPIAILYVDRVRSSALAVPDAWRGSLEFLARHAGWRLGVLTRLTSPSTGRPAGNEGPQAAPDERR